MKILVISCLAATLAAVVSTSQAQTYTNPTSITIPDSGAATPYPATITVSGFAGTILDLNVSIVGFSHTFPGDVGMLLVGPGGQQVLLDGRVGGSTDAVNANVTFDDQAATALASPIVSGTFRPAASTMPAFGAPAPTDSGNLLLSTFNGTSPNGTWSLYVQDFAASDQGSIAGGYSLTFNAVPEPSTWALLGLGAVSAGVVALRRRRAVA